jgi:hypothetical protein
MNAAKKEISEKFNFSDFTEDQYRKIIQHAKKYYKFRFFSTEVEKINEPFVLWRHDIDVSIHRALKIAQIEKEEGVNSTFFIMLGSEFYNIFEKDIMKRLIDIQLMGHQIGLHFSCDLRDIKNHGDLEHLVIQEKNILETFLERDVVKAVSFHNPNLAMDKVNLRANVIGGLINTYGQKLVDNCGYVSDSNGYWRYERLMDVILGRKYSKLQVLTHPVWWPAEVMSPKDRIMRCVQGRAEFVNKFYDEMLEKLGRLNVQ